MAIARDADSLGGVPGATNRISDPPPAPLVNTRGLTDAGTLYLADDGSLLLAGDLVGVEAGLGPLQDNGGPTPTHGLTAGSQHLDAGDPSGCEDGAGTLLFTDQRGAERVGRCDRGAYENGGAPAIFTDGFESGGPWRWQNTSLF